MITRYLLIIAGFISLILGVIGSVLPLLPTTPFLLLSAYLFGKSSPRFHAWLLNHPYFGEFIRDYLIHKGISKRRKIRIYLILWAAMILSMLIARNGVVTLLLIVTGLSVSYFIHTRKTLP